MSQLLWLCIAQELLVADLDACAANRVQQIKSNKTCCLRLDAELITSAASGRY